jgi:di/tricarboxylate transporter
MAPITPTESGAVALELPQTGHKSLDVNALTKFLLGPLVAIMLWALPLGIDPTARKAFAVVGFMIVLWILEPISHAVTALIGCYLFWVLDVAKFSVAFSGFASTTPWILFGGLLIGEASSRTGLAKRLGYVILRKTGTSYSRLLLGVIILSFLINFLVPAGPARVSVIAPILVGILAAFNFSNRGNAAKGLFLVMSYTSVLFDKMIMSGASALLTRGIIEEVAGASVFWSQWFFAFLPATVLTILACWVTIQWFYPGEKKELPESREYFHNFNS